MTPPPFSRIQRNTGWVTQNVPFRCTFNTLSQAASVALARSGRAGCRHVDEDIGAAEMLDGVVEHRLPARHGGDVGAVGNGPAALGLDRIDNLLRHRLVAALPSRGPPRSLTTTAAPSRANSFA